VTTGRAPPSTGVRGAPGAPPFPRGSAAECRLPARRLFFAADSRDATAVVTDDPLERFEHDHVDLNRRVVALREALTGATNGRQSVLGAALVRDLVTFTDDLFDHFAREEEGLFPFVLEHLPGLLPAVTALIQAHDRICGAASRLLALERRAAPVPESLALASAIFARFESQYAEHSRYESEFLRSLGPQLDARQRDQLAELLRAL